MNEKIKKKIAAFFGYDNPRKFFFRLILDLGVMVSFILMIAAVADCSCVVGIPYSEYLELNITEQNQTSPYIYLPQLNTSINISLKDICQNSNYGNSYNSYDKYL